MSADDDVFKLPDILARWPWKSAINKHYEKCDIESMAWSESFHAFSPKAQKIFNLCKPNLLSSRAYPNASNDGCRLTCDLMFIYAYFDDYTDSMDVEPVRLWANTVMDALRNPTADRPKGEPLIGEITSSFWRNAIKSVTPCCQKRFINEFEAYTQSVIEQAQDRKVSQLHNVESYMNMRRNNVGAKPSFALIEMNMELPQHVVDHPMIVTLRECATDMLCLANDLYSFNVEQSRGEGHNIVIIIMQYYGLNVHQAINRIAEMHEELLDLFLSTHKSLPSFNSLQLDEWVAMYVDGLAQWVRANDTWSFETWRYFQFDGPRVQRERTVKLLPKALNAGDTSCINAESLWIQPLVDPSRARPKNVGIVTLEFYAPKRSVRRSDLSGAKDVNQYIAFTDDREDIHSLTLNAVHSMLTKYNIDRRSIGRIEVGLQEADALSKSVKSRLVDLFAKAENTDIDGTTNISEDPAPAAILNAVNWIHSPSWDGRYAIVVVGDHGRAKGNPINSLSGTIAFAALIGPDAAIEIEPVFGSEAGSISDNAMGTSFASLSTAYQRFVKKQPKKIQVRADGIASASNTISTLNSFDYFLYGGPNSDFARAAHQTLSSTTGSSVPPLRPELWMTCTNHCGYLPSASLFGALASLISNVVPAELKGRRVGMFSVSALGGSTFFAGHIVKDTSAIRKQLDLDARLTFTNAVSSREYLNAMQTTKRSSSWTPFGIIRDLLLPYSALQGSVEHVPSHAFYLSDIQSGNVRIYSQKV